jgi:hypothetical protein
MFVQSVNEGPQFTTFTCSDIMHLGKWKYYEMKVEKGLNTITDTTKINTADVFPPVNNLQALEPSIDDLQNYVVYSRVSWNKLVGMNVTSYEVQYKRNDEAWENAEVVTLSENSLKLVLKEQVLYNIRVRGTGKEQVKGKWAYVDVDASLFLIDNPIQNRTWYVNLQKFENNINAYVSYFEKLGYTKNFLLDNVDNIEIILANNFSCGLFSMILVLNGLYIQDFNALISQKNFIIKGSPNGELFISEGIISPSFKSLVGEKITTKITVKYNSVSNNYATFSAVNIVFLTNLKDLNLILENSTPSLDVTTKIIDGNGQLKIENVNLKSDYTGLKNKMIGFYKCASIKESFVNDFYENFVDSFSLNKNKSTAPLNSGVKYRTCFPSFTAIPEDLIPTNGSDTAKYGWNV